MKWYIFGIIYMIFHQSHSLIYPHHIEIFPFPPLKTNLCPSEVRRYVGSERATTSFMIGRKFLNHLEQPCAPCWLRYNHARVVQWPIKLEFCGSNEFIQKHKILALLFGSWWPCQVYHCQDSTQAWIRLSEVSQTKGSIFMGEDCQDLVLKWCRTTATSFVHSRLRWNPNVKPLHPIRLLHLQKVLWS